MLNYVQSWLVCWLNQDPSRYSMDYQIYMGSSVMVYCFGGCYCTCALINWAVLLQLASEQGSTLNLSYLYLKQKVLYYEIIKYASGHLLYA